MKQEVYNAIQNRDVLRCFLLLEKMDDVDMEIEQGITMLMFCCKQGMTSVAEELVRRGANLDLREPDLNWSALTFAIKNLHEDCAKLLIESGADVNNKDEDGESFLHSGSIGNQPRIVEMLIHAGIDVNQPDTFNWTPLHFACRRGNAQFVKLLIDSGANVEAKNNDQCTPLELAILNGNVECVALLEAYYG